MRRFGNVFVAQGWHSVEAHDFAGMDCPEQRAAGDVGAHYRHAERQSLDRGDVTDQRQCGIEVREGAGGSGRSDDQRHIQKPSSQQHTASGAVAMSPLPR